MSALDDPLYAELLHRRPTPADPLRMADGPTARWLAHKWCQQPVEVVDDYDVDGMEPAA